MVGVHERMNASKNTSGIFATLPKKLEREMSTQTIYGNVSYPKRTKAPCHQMKRQGKESCYDDSNFMSS